MKNALNIVASAALKSAKISANSSCMFFFHEIKMPESVKKLIKR